MAPAVRDGEEFKSRVMIAPAPNEGKQLQAHRAWEWAIEPVDDVVLVVDFGPSTRLIARRVREAQSTPRSSRRPSPPRVLARTARHHPLGRPKSVYETPALARPAIYETGCRSSASATAPSSSPQLGGRDAHGRGEYGRTKLELTGPHRCSVTGRRPPSLDDHGDCITAARGHGSDRLAPDAPGGLRDAERASTASSSIRGRPHDRGADLLERFLHDVCAIAPLWTTSRSSRPRSRRSSPGRAERVLCALSAGGLGSRAALVHKAIGDQLTCVFVDTGLMRAGEAEQVEGLPTHSTSTWSM